MSSPAQVPATRGRDVRRSVVTVRDGQMAPSIDRVATEEPLEIRVDGSPVTVTMRTPGDDFELAVGWCVAEGVVAPGDVATARYCAGRDAEGHHTFNVVDVATRSGAPVPPERRRTTTTTSACGVCGTATIAAVHRHVGRVAHDRTRLLAETLAELPDRLRAAQAVFARTGGLHAAGVFSAAGELVCAREDVGRHNAVDKVLGWADTHDALPLAGHVLMVSGRVAFEIVQKALVAGLPVVAAVSAPTSLATTLAEDAGLTLVGFLRGTSMNVYTHPERVLTDST